MEKVIEIRVLTADLVKAKEETTRLKEQMKLLDASLKAGTITQAEYNAAMADLIPRTKSAEVNQKALNKQVDDAIKVNSSAKDSYNRLSAQYSLNVAILNKYSQAQIDADVNLKKLQKDTEDMRGEMSKLKQATGDHGLEVAKYKENIKAAAGEMGLLNNKFTELGKAILLNPFMLIVAAIGGLIAGFKELAKYNDDLDKSFERVGGRIDGFKMAVAEQFQPAAKWMVDLIDKPKEALKDLGMAIVDNILNRFTSVKTFFQAIALAFKGEFVAAATKAQDGLLQLTTGVKDATTKFKDLAERTKAYSKINEEVTAMYQDLEDNARAWAIEEDKLTGIISKNMIIAKRRSANDAESTAKSAAAIAIAEAAERKRYEGQLKIANDRLAAVQKEAKLRSSVGELGDEMEQKLADAQRKVNQVINDGNVFLEKKITLENKILDRSEKNAQDEERINALRLKHASDFARLEEKIARDLYLNKKKLRELEMAEEDDKNQYFLSLATEKEQEQYDLLVKALQERKSLIENFDILSLTESQNRRKQDIIDSEGFQILNEEQKNKIIKKLDDDFLSERVQKVDENYLKPVSEIFTQLSDIYSFQKQRELQTAGDNEVMKADIEKKYAKKKQKVDIGLAVIDTARGVARAFADYMFPLSAVIAAITAAAGAVQIATIASQKFATGGVVHGPGSGTSDSIPAMISNGEAVINARSVAESDVMSVTGRPVDILSHINAYKGYGRKFATGYIPTQTSIAPGSDNMVVFDTFADRIVRGINDKKVIQDISGLIKAQNTYHVSQTQGDF